MDSLIPYTSKIFLIYGIDLLKKRKIVKYLVHPIPIIFIISNIIFAVYRLFTLPRHIPLDIAYIAFLPFLLADLRTVISTHRKIKRIYKFCSKVLTSEAKDRIKKRDKRFVIILIIYVAAVTLSMSYFTAIDGGEQSVSLSIGYTRTDHIANDPILSKAYFAAGFLLPIIFFYIFPAHWISVFYYIMVQYLLNEYANDCHIFIQKHSNDFRRISVGKNSKTTDQNGRQLNKVKDWNGNNDRKVTGSDQVYQDLLNRLKLYNDLVHEINETISIIPFGAQVADFTFILSGISFVVIYDSNFTVMFILLTVGGIISFNLLIFSSLVKITCDASDMMAKVWKETVKLLSCPDMMTQSESWSRLNTYMSGGSISQSTVWNLYKIKRTLLLSFASQVIPFTIMIITTFGEFKSKK